MSVINKRAICKLAGIPEHWASSIEKESKTYRRAEQVKALKETFNDVDDAARFAIEKKKAELKQVGLIE